MKIHLRPLGVLQNYFGDPRIEIDCSSGITLFQLCEIIGERWGSILPSGFWNQTTRQFAPHVLMMSGGKELDRHADQVLKEEQEIILLVPSEGG